LRIPLEMTRFDLAEQDIWPDVLRELPPRDILLMVISLIVGLGIAHYYYRRQLRDQREQNRELKSSLEDIEYRLHGQRVARIRELIARFRPIPRSLSEGFVGDDARKIGLYNEDVLYAQQALEKKLREVTGQDRWQHFSSAFDLVLHVLMGEPTTIGEYLLNLENYILDSIPTGMWYNAFCSALYHSKKFSQIGVPLGSPDAEGVFVIEIKRAKEEDLFLVMDGKVENFANNAYQQLRQTALEASGGINIAKQQLEQVL